MAKAQTFLALDFFAAGLTATFFGFGASSVPEFVPFPAFRLDFTAESEGLPLASALDFAAGCFLLVGALPLALVVMPTP